jgi:hypothetical protein
MQKKRRLCLQEQKKIPEDTNKTIKRWAYKQSSYNYVWQKKIPSIEMLSGKCETRCLKNNWNLTHNIINIIFLWILKADLSNLRKWEIDEALHILFKTVIGVVWKIAERVPKCSSCLWTEHLVQSSTQELFQQHRQPIWEKTDSSNKNIHAMLTFIEES